MAAKNSPRKKTPVDIETAILANSARRCTLCFHLNGDLTEKIGQIAHLDKDPSNGAEDNLAVWGSQGGPVGGATSAGGGLR
jgi:hypothetical protein